MCHAPRGAQDPGRTDRVAPEIGLRVCRFLRGVFRFQLLKQSVERGLETVNSECWVEGALGVDRAYRLIGLTSGFLWFRAYRSAIQPRRVHVPKYYILGPYKVPPIQVL